MKNTSALLFAIIGVTLSACKQKQAVVQQEVEYVNTIIGTPYEGFGPEIHGGGTLPAVGLPYAMTNFLPQSCENNMGHNAYKYEDSTLMGFVASHQPTVWMGDYGYVSVMPQVGDLKLLPKDRALRFSHQDEIARPYYYSVVLKTANNQSIKSEIAAASRAALLQFSFPEAAAARFVIQGINLNRELTDPSNSYEDRIKKLKGYVKIDPVNNEVTGYNPDRMSAQIGPDLPNFKGYFVIQCDKKISSFGTWDTTSHSDGSLEQYGTRMGAYINFATKAGEKVKVKIGTSFISIEQARENLKKEIPDWDFDKLLNNTRNTWQAELSKFQPEGISEDQKVIFYTALFHTMQFPREMGEYGRYYSAFDDEVHEGNSYTDYSLWDTYRALHPLLVFTQPDRVDGMITALLQMYKEGGWLPMWPNPAETNIMISTHADAVIADAYIKGFRGFDTTLAYEALWKDATVAPDRDTLLPYGDRDLWTSYEVRAGLTRYHQMGYIPFGKTAESVSRTMEYASDDHAIAQMAKAMGKEKDYEQLMAWSKNYKNLYNPKAGFFVPRMLDGSFLEYNPKKALGRQDGFTEGDQWTYLFGALHDVQGMIDLMGGNEAFAAKLDENFTGNHYRHDNEPGHHYAYLYDYCGQPWKTQELIRKHTRINYLNRPMGINGNEDCGQMAAWYLFGVMGFYPVTPASGIYAIGAPQYPALTINYKVGKEPKQLKIIANGLSEKNLYVQSVSLDGHPIAHPFISHQELINGSKLVFEMGPEPNKEWK